MPLGLLVLALLAIPLGYVNPRVGRSANLIIAVLVFVVYHNGLSITKAWVGQGRLAFSLGLWLPHALAATAAVLLLLRRVYMQRWLPSFLRPRGRATP